MASLATSGMQLSAHHQRTAKGHPIFSRIDLVRVRLHAACSHLPAPSTAPGQRASRLSSGALLASQPAPSAATDTPSADRGGLPAWATPAALGALVLSGVAAITAPPAAAAAAAAVYSDVVVVPVSEFIAKRVVVHMLPPVVITWACVAALNHLAARAERLPNPSGVSFADVAPTALRGPAVGALVVMLGIRLVRNLFRIVDEVVAAYQPNYGWAHETIEPMVSSTCAAFATLDAALLRVYAAVGALFASWALIELKNSVVSVWLSNYGPGGSGGVSLGTLSMLGGSAEGDGRGSLDANDRLELQRTLLPLSSLLSWAIACAGGMVALYALGFNLLPLLTVGGASTLVFGFASQQVLTNAITGVSIFFSRPFVTGETVTLQQGSLQVSGTIIKVTPLRTMLRDPDGVVILLPNKTVSDMVVYNRSRSAYHPTEQLGPVIRQPLRLRVKLSGSQLIANVQQLRKQVEARLAEGEAAGVLDRGSGQLTLGRLTEAGVELLLTGTLLTSSYGVADEAAQQLLLDLYSIAGDNGAGCASLG